MPVTKHKGQRVGVFIDTQNLYHCAKNLYHARVNFGAIMKDAVAGRTLVRAMAYVVTTESGEEKNFFEALGKIGIDIITKDLQVFGGGAKKADWDVGLAIDAVKLAPRLDAVIIVSGDGDFCPLVEYLKIRNGNQVEIISFGKSTSGKLRDMADDFLDLSENPRKYLLGYGGSGRRNSETTSSNNNPINNNTPKPTTQ
ncbi:MAG TPA: NYN domain-containing protein [Candidatus Paceibacterota bacterium]